jgi:CHAT domain-containing protein
MNIHEREYRGVGLSGHEEGGFTPLADRPYAHPFFWAPFILIGNYL